MSKPAWSHAALEIAQTITHLQDVLMTGIGHCLQDIKIEDYQQFKIDLVALPFVASLVTDSCDALFSLKRNQRGKKPLWFEWGEDVKYFGLQVKEAIQTIEEERRRNDLEIIKCRLSEMQSQCSDLQKRILEIMPPERHDNQIYISQRSAIEWTDLARTLEDKDFVLTGSGFRYRGRRS